MGLFSKKECSICGGDAGRVFTKKLEDGVLCKDCVGKLSPWFSDRRSARVVDIEEQLLYRKMNQDAVAAFRVTRVLNGRYKILLDEDARKFCVTSSSHWQEENPDVLSFDDVKGIWYDVRERKTDVTPEPPEGEEQDQQGGEQGNRAYGTMQGGPQDSRGFGGPHGGPDFGGPRGGFEQRGHGGPGFGGPHGGPGFGGPRDGRGMYPQGMQNPDVPAGARLESDGRYYTYDYDFYVTISVNNPFFGEMEFQLNDSDVDDENGAEYRKWVDTCEEIKSTLAASCQFAGDDASATGSAVVQKRKMTCPFCGAETTPTDAGTCEFCGGALG